MASPSPMACSPCISHRYVAWPNRATAAERTARRANRAKRIRRHRAVIGATGCW